MSTKSSIEELPKASVPLGTILPFALEVKNIPTGWMLCDGRIIEDTTLPICTYLNKDSEGNVRLPNLCGRTIIGSDESQGYKPGKLGGEATVTLSTAQLPSHNHVVRQDFGNAGIGFRTEEGSQVPFIMGGFEPNTTEAVGLNEAHNNMQPYFVANYIIFVGTN